MNRYLLFIISALITSLTILTGCQDEDFGFTQEEVFKGAYERNFEAKYGKIDPNQSWDLSTYGIENSYHAETRAGEGTSASSDGWYYVESGTVNDFIKNKLPEGTNNTNNIEEFGLLSSTNPFEIIPVFQAGASDVDWEAHVVLVTTSGSKDVTFFTKSDGNKLQVLGKDMQCPSCQGHRMVAGSGDVTCTVCSGTKYLHAGDADAVAVDCSTCGGTGKAFEQCKTCAGKGNTGTCSNCKGAGYKGTGTWNVTDLFYKWNGCTICGGDGSRSLAQLIGGNAGTIVKGSGKEICTKCLGTGQVLGDCPDCVEGKRYACGWCDSQGKGIVCPICRGNGTVDDPNWEVLLKTENTKDVGAIRSAPMLISSSTFDNMSTENGLIYFYILIKNGKNNYATTGTKQTSIAKMMRVMNCAHPTNINSEYEVKLIACEEANGKNTDNDFNDFVFLLVGRPRVPTVVTVAAGKSYSRVTDKRYMIEDMGSAVDWDFNDIVVDMSRSTKYTLNSTANQLTKGTETTAGVIKWLGGTAPIQVLINNKEAQVKIDDPTDMEQTVKQLENQNPPSKPGQYSGKDPIGWEVGSLLKESVCKEWDPKSNNISVRVWIKNVDDPNVGFWCSVFPENGKVPYMIATDQNINWVRIDGNNIDKSLWEKKLDTSYND